MEDAIRRLKTKEDMRQMFMKQSADNHTVPYWHEVQWNAQYPIGGYKIDHRLDPNPPFDYYRQ